MELQHFSHGHPLLFDKLEGSHESEKAYCSGCGEMVLGPSFSCMLCRFHLHKHCAEAPSTVIHPFHPNHSLNLLARSPRIQRSTYCDLCDEKVENFVYHCSCGLDFHIKCALFSYNVAVKKVGGQLQHIARKDPLTSTETLPHELKKAKCIFCWQPLLDSEYLSLNCGFFLHTKCVELPLEINYHPFHRQHSLLLQFNSDHLPCQMCHRTQKRGLVYCCSLCKFVFDIDCVSSTFNSDVSSHEHTFTQKLRPFSFTCDACGTIGNYVFYICSTCSLMVHKKCISLPRIISSQFHWHPLFHKYSVVDNDCGTQECLVCHEKVVNEFGCYYCSKCKSVVHVNCALQEPSWYDEIESKDTYLKLIKHPLDTMDPPFSAIEEIKLGKIVVNTEIKHFSHQHNLFLRDEVKDDRCGCNGCSELITRTFYCCLKCDFFLHKSCAELPRKKHILLHKHRVPHDLVIPNPFLECAGCFKLCAGFAYQCEKCKGSICIRCADTSLVHTSQGHKHPLRYYVFKLQISEYCSCCGGNTESRSIYRCKDCNFNVHRECARLPQIVRHKFDEHYLTLKYGKDNDYSEYHYCDICEKRRIPSNWFYHCATCNTSAHLQCVLGDYPFIHVGFTFTAEEIHPHPIVVVQKDYLYPECCNCGKLCMDPALECLETGCNYIVHLKCGISRLQF